jgi:hypothetical protein
MEQACNHERNWIIHLQVHSGFNDGYYWHNTPGIIMTSSEGGRIDKLGNSYTNLLQFSPFSLGYFLPSRIVGFRDYGVHGAKPPWEIFFGPSHCQVLTSDLLSRQLCENVKASLECRMDSQASAQGKEMDLGDS